MDFKPGGGLCRILEAVCKFKSDQGWRNLNFQSPSRMDRNMEMLMQIGKALELHKCFIQPNVFIRHEVDKVTRDKLKDIIVRHQGKLTETEQGATHVVFPAISSGDSEEYFRVVLKRDRSALLHKLNTPDSFDQWTTSIDIDIDPESPFVPSSDEPYYVHSRWVNDLECYNEWMNEEDYECDANGKRKPPRAK